MKLGKCGPGVGWSAVDTIDGHFKIEIIQNALHLVDFAFEKATLVRFVRP